MCWTRHCWVRYPVGGQVLLFCLRSKWGSVTILEVFFIEGSNVCDFLLSSLDDEGLSNTWGLLLKERICS